MRRRTVSPIGCLAAAALLVTGAAACDGGDDDLDAGSAASAGATATTEDAVSPDTTATGTTRPVPSTTDATITSTTTEPAPPATADSTAEESTPTSDADVTTSAPNGSVVGQPAVCDPLAEIIALEDAFAEDLSVDATSTDLVPLIEQNIDDLDAAFADAERFAPPDLVDDVVAAREVTIVSNELFVERLAEVDSLLDVDYEELGETIVERFGADTMIEIFTNVNGFSEPECGFTTFD